MRTLISHIVVLVVIQLSGEARMHITSHRLLSWADVTINKYHARLGFVLRLALPLGFLL
jgi:hypothetical protein